LSIVVNLSGKKALVTGAGIGIGQGVAIELARCGADVAVHYPPMEQTPEQTTRGVTELGVKTVAIEGDLRDPAVCVDVVDRAADELDGLDILVNNSGVTISSVHSRRPGISWPPTAAASSTSVPSTAAGDFPAPPPTPRPRARSTR
jgi:NAD(P)-dependent dehydrogenase (short-subunit alcohol dehydrogenase family)